MTTPSSNFSWQPDPQVGAPAWRDGRHLIVPLQADHAARCYRCGAPATSRVPRTLYWHHPAWYLLILAGVLIYALVALAIRRRADVVVGLCPRHAAARRRAGWIGAGLLGAAAGALALAFVGPAAMGLLMIPTTIGGLGVLMVRSNLVRVRRIESSHVWLANPAPALLEGLSDISGRGLPSATARFAPR